MMKRTSLIVGFVISAGWASGCLAVYDWDFQAGSGGAGTGGDAGKGGGSVVSSTSSSGMGGAGGGAVSSSSSSSSSSGMMCPGCTWGRRIGDDAEQIAFDMVMANDNSVFLVGSSKGTIALDGTNVVNSTVANSNQPFLAKYDKFGQPQWITRPLDWPSTGGDGSQIAIGGNRIAWMGSINNGASGTDTFVEMRDVNGGRDSTIWRKVYGTTGNDGLRSISVSPDGTRVYLAGAISNQNLAFNNCPALQPFTTSGGNQNLVVLALDAQNGNCLWGKSWGGGHHLNGSISVVAGSDGTPFVSGHIYSGTITNNQGIQIPQAPPQDPMGVKYVATAFILKIDKTTGTLLAGRGYAYGAFIGMAADHSTGTILASGGIGGTVQFLGTQHPGAVAAMDGADGVVFAYDENLNEKWGHFWEGAQNQFCFSVETDNQGRTYVACSTRSKIDTDVVVNCATDKNCSVLFPMQSATGTIFGSQIKTFAETQSQTNMGLTFMTAATPTAVSVAGSWTAPVRFWDDVLLDPLGSFGDFDIGIGKVEPLP